PTASGLFRTAMALRLEPALIQRTGNRLDVIAAYAIGTVAAFWLIEEPLPLLCEVRKGCSGGPRSKADDFRFCEGFRMTADRDDAACTGAVVRKPPMKERA
ncbi:MAG TPA: hypothetical protein VK495_15470, partial [Steroidobacteraceae bacterium]|nr:hypothetical protein [Steroidobacteraceae bacterium]